MSSSTVFFLFFFIQTVSLLAATNPAEEAAFHRNGNHGNASELFNKLLDMYDKRDRPFVGYRETEINVSLGVVTFSGFKEAEMEFVMQAHVRQLWIDPRLAHQQNRSLSFHLREDIEKLWLPDIYISNAKKVTFDNLWLGIISPNGQVYFTFLATIVLNCKMNFINYPMDKQICPIIIESYGHTKDQVTYKWLNGGSVSVFEKQLAEFEVSDVKKMNARTVQYISGPYSQLEVRLTFSRRIGYYLIQIFIPCLLIVMTSWTIFWMDEDAVTDRAALGVSSVLSIVFLLGSSNSTMPRVSYIKAIDWFMIVSFIFVFLAVIECVVVYKIMKKKEKKKVQRGLVRTLLDICLPRTTGTETITNDNIIMNDRANQAESKEIPEVPELVDKTNQEETKASTGYGVRLRNNVKDIAINDDYEEDAEKSSNIDYGHILDIICRVVFPLSFILFNFAFWSTYLNAYD